MAGSAKPSSWEPPGAVPAAAEETASWEPPGALIPVRAHARKPRTHRAAAVGGMIGGSVGKLVGLPAAGIGAYAGGVGLAGAAGGLAEAGAELATGQTPDLAEIGRQAGSQALQEGLGRGLAKGASMAGRPIMQWALKATPEVAQTAVREGISATRFGLKKLMTRLGQVSGVERVLVAKAANRGIGWADPEAMAQEAFSEVADQLQGAPGKKLGELAKLRDEFVRDNPQQVSPWKQLAMRKYYDSAESGQYLNLGRGKRPVPLSDVEGLWNKAMSDRVRESLRLNVPGIEDPEVYRRITGVASTPADLMKLKDVAFPATKDKSLLHALAQRGARPAMGAVLGAGAGAAYRSENRTAGGVEGAMLGASLATPSALSLAALGLNNPLFLQLLRQTPRFVNEGSQ